MAALITIIRAVILFVTCGVLIMDNGMVSTVGIGVVLINACWWAIYVHKLMDHGRFAKQMDMLVTELKLDIAIYKQQEKYWETRTGSNWVDVLGLRDAPHIDAAAINTAYRNLCKILHPDVGGSPFQFMEITKARKEGLKHVENV